ncbi:MAG: hypothetical protein ACREFC_11560 [Stellaceae bacterium]
MTFQFPRMNFVFAAVLVSALALFSAGASAEGTVSGVYKGNGKPADLTQVSAYKGDPEQGKPVIVLVFSSKAQTGDPKPASSALFGKFGDAIVARVFADGKIYSGDLVHSNLDVPGGSIQLFGGLKMAEFAAANGEIAGHLTSGGQKSMCDWTWEVDLQFKAKAP